jgi:hypothetical protein
MHFSCGFGWYQVGTFTVYSARKRDQIGQIPYEDLRKYGGGISQVATNWFLLTATKDWHCLPNFGLSVLRGAKKLKHRPATEKSALRGSLEHAQSNG